MSIYGSAVKNPITTIMIFVALIVMGLYSLVRLPIDFYPELEFPAISVYTQYNGASAADIETNITRRIEDNLNSVSNLKDISSVSRDNVSIVICEFEWGTNLDEATNEIRDAISFVEQALPEDAEKPAIFKFSSSMMPIMIFALTADESYPAIEKIVDEKIINPLNRIDGVGAVGFFGAPGREIQIDVDPLKMASYNMTIEQIAAILNAENMNIPAGELKMGKIDYPLRTRGEFGNSDEIKNIVLANINGQAIYLKDLATVKDTLREMSIDEKMNGRTGARLIIQKQSGANTVKIAREVNKLMPELQKTLPPDIQIETIFDTSTFIQGSINNLTETLMYAGIFVVLVVLFFLGRWRTTFIIVLTIPISLIVAFIYLFVSGSSINIISLSSLSIAIGMVVDDAIVVLENITKHVERGSTPREAAIYATNEVWLAVIVTTLTVVTVFLPLTLVGGMTGELFRPLGIVVSITVVTSTLAAISLTPMLASRMMRLKRTTGGRKGLYDRTILPLLDRLDNFYERSLRWALHHKLIVGLTALFIFLGSLLLVPKLGFEFMPEADESRMTAVIELPTGIRMEETASLARKIDNFIFNNIPEARITSTSAGADDRGGFLAVFGTTGSNIINYNIRLNSLEERERSVWEISDALRSYLETLPEIVTYTVTPNGGFGASTSNNIEIEIYGYDFEETSALAQAIADTIRTVKGARDVKISRDPSKPELEIVPDREKIAQNGLNTYTVANAVRNRIEGPYMTKYREEGDEYDIVLRYKEDYRNSISDLERIALLNNQGKAVQLGDVADVVEYWAPPNIERKSRERIVTVSAVPYGTSLGKLFNEVKAKMDKMEIPSDVYIEVGGAIQDMQDSTRDLGLLLVLILLLTYIVMASQFESLKMPLIIMFSIPFAFSGVILALYLTNTTMSVISMVGGVMLVGIVVKNAIVLVDYINLMRDRNYELNEAIILSGKSRLRPVLMTSVTTVLGMLPLAISSGEGSEIWSPMGIAVIGGLVFSTLVTMLLVPVVYQFFVRRSEKRKQEITYDFMNGENQ
ncbi:MAG: efflux RND transporter permease subunit [Bacteroidota bacterium]